MALARLNFDEISEFDLLELKETGVPEGIHYEYKVESYGKADADVKEFLKDASSFVNTAGGHLIIGMEATDGVANNLVALKGLDADQEVLRLEHMMRDGLEPRVMGARIKAVPIASGGFVIVLRLPRSWNPPHRVRAKNHNRFYIRNSAGSHETSVEELRVLFNVAATAHDRVRAFRQERLSKIMAGEGCVPLAVDPDKVVLHIVPFSAFGEQNQVDLHRAYDLRSSLRPISANSSYSRYNFDGFINGRGTDTCYGYTQLFRNGCIEAIKSRVLWPNGGYKTIRVQSFVEHFLEALPHYLDTLKALDVAPPLVVMLTLVEVSGARLEVGWNPWSLEDTVPIRQSVLELPESVIEDYGTTEDYRREIRPALDALWNAGGYPGCNYFNEDGAWIGYQ